MDLHGESRSSRSESAAIRHNWTQDEILALFQLPFNDLIYQAQSIHRRILTQTRSRFPPCFRSRPAAARKIAPIVPRAHISIRA